jgi:hypothetical protein
MLAHSVDHNNAIWYLGIDFGTTGVSAVLLNQTTAQRYPLFWSNELSISQEQLQTVNPQLAIRSSAEAIFRLPAITYSGEAASKLFVKFPVTPIIVGSLAAKLANEQPGVFLENFKPYLNIGVPYYCPDQQQWQPQIKLPRQQFVSIFWVRRTLQALLATLSPKSTLPEAVMKVGAVGLTPSTLALALGQLEGVIFGYPASWGDTYQLNLREALLDAKLVKHPEQVFFVEDAIAICLAILPSVALNQDPEEKFSFLPRSRCRGGMLVINGDLTTTELALVDLPDDLKQLTHDDFSVLSLAYGSDALAQDIFGQLLYPQLSETQLQQISPNSEIELPQPGQPEQQKRDRLTLLLQSSAFGKALLKASGYLLPILQHKEEFTLELGTDRWLVKAVDLETKVLLPFVQQLNQGLIRLMVETGLVDAKITQVVGVGGTILETLEKWIQQKLPHAKILHNALNKSVKQQQENLISHSLKTSGWVATGLATLPLYPQILNRSQHQYSDYFLLLELIRAFSQLADDSARNTYSLEEILQQLERRGLNTSVCYERLVNLVNGQLPAGFVPSPEQDSQLVTSQTSLFDELTEAPLFSQAGDSESLAKHGSARLPAARYCLNLQQRQRLANHLELIVSATSQQFAEPLFLKW